MPLKRTPPTTPAQKSQGTTSTTFHVATEKSGSPLQHYESEPDLHSLAIVTERKKRKYDDENPDLSTTIMQMFTSFSIEQDKRFQELKTSIDLMSQKYDEFLTKISALEKENQRDKVTIKELEEKLEHLERKSRGVSVEIRNLPKQKDENKECLQNTIIQLGEVLNVEVGNNSIKDIYRIKSKDSSNPVIVDFTTVLIKEKVLKAVKSFNKYKQKGHKLNTTHLNSDNTLKPLYVSETLTSKNQKLFFLARQFQKSHAFNFCWTANGIVYLKQTEGSPHIRINNVTDLDKIRKTAITT